MTSYGRVGLIPARAGNTPFQVIQSRANRAHPRSRGEHAFADFRTNTTWGSSPLARGTPKTLPLMVQMMGLIPARAGNTYFSSALSAPRWAHPRSRGEHYRMPVVAFNGSGSSPLARGTHPKIDLGIASIGLIPARAGNT